MTKNITTEIINAINGARSILVCGHIRPDGDCVGSALAMRQICRNLGKSVDAVTGDMEKPAMFDFLPGYADFCVVNKNSYDLFISVDCATDKRLGENYKYFASAENSVVIDHHPTNCGYGKINYIDGTASSTCAILFELFESTGLIDRTTATLLYTGLSTDTGHFMHSNTDSKVFGIAQKLCGYGLDVGKINHDIYCNKSMRRIKLTARALDSIRLYENGRIALMVITQDDLKACECKSEDTEGLIDYASSVSGVKIAISMCEQPDSVFRVSWRSPSVNVAAAAEKFGGGGHELAAGCIINGNRYDVAEKVLAAGAAALKQ